jgi:hypothetical protein
MIPVRIYGRLNGRDRANATPAAHHPPRITGIGLVRNFIAWTKDLRRGTPNIKTANMIPKVSTHGKMIV